VDGGTFCIVDGLLLVCGVVPALGPVGMPLKVVASPCNMLEDSRLSVIDRAFSNLESAAGLLIGVLRDGRADWVDVSVFCQGSDRCPRGSRGKLGCTFETRSAFGPVGG
jgi:hypothetical protein